MHLLIQWEAWCTLWGISLRRWEAIFWRIDEEEMGKPKPGIQYQAEASPESFGKRTAGSFFKFLFQFSLWKQLLQQEVQYVGPLRCCS